MPNNDIVCDYSIRNVQRYSLAYSDINLLNFCHRSLTSSSLRIVLGWARELIMWPVITDGFGNC